MSQYSIEITFSGEDFVKLLKNQLISFKQFVDILSDRDRLGALMFEPAFFETLHNNKLISHTDIEYMVSKLNDIKTISFFSKFQVLPFLLEANLLDFKFVVDKHSEKHSGRTVNSLDFLISFFNHDEKFKILQEKRIIPHERVQYMLNNFTPPNLISLNKSYNLSKYCFEYFLFTDELIKKFDEFVKHDILVRQNLQNETSAYDHLENFLQYAERAACCVNRKQDEKDEYLKYVQMYALIYKFDYKSWQKNELFELLRESKKAQNTLMQIAENNLEYQYKFEDLKEVLTKDDKKRKHRMNF